MNVKKCYEQLSGDYQGVLSILSSDEYVGKFLIKFLEDKTFDNLQLELKNNNREKAFLYVHALKGICTNMGFKKLYEVCSLLTENLRSATSVITEESIKLFNAIKEEYNRTVFIIKKTLESE